MSADEAALLRSMVALVRQRYGLDEIGAAAYLVEMPNRIKALEAENAALRARSVPAIVWEGEIARAGSFGLTSNGEIWFVCVKVGEQVIVLLKGKTGGKPACEAAFLRLVGAGS